MASRLTYPCHPRLVLLFVVCYVSLAASKVQYKVRCLPDAMVVDVIKSDSIVDVYLNNLKNYPDNECQAKLDGNRAQFHLSLVDIHRCGVTKVSNKMTGTKMYYHKIVVEHEGTPPGKEDLLVKCTTANHTLTKRNVLPAGFMEPDDLEVTTTLTGRAPEPMLNVGVRQGNEPVTGELNVNPGTPLTMEIYLDKESAHVYGVLVSYMQVTDTKQQEETIIFNGCSVDPYLFENFNTVNGDFLSAKFRAFKFPDSTYVQFRGTVNVCLDKCRGVDCSNGQIGYGRRRRDIRAINIDPNKLFEVSLTTFIKINFLDSEAQELKSSNQNTTESKFILKDHIYSIREEDDGEDIGEEEQEVKLKTVSRTGGGLKWSENDDVLQKDLKYAVVYETESGSTTITMAWLLLPLVVISIAFA